MITYVLVLSVLGMPPEATARPAFVAARSHWAYQPVRRPALPEVQDTAWSHSAMDRFVLARLEEAGLAPSPPADRRTLIRRVYFDLTGLPPRYEEVEAFVRDPAPNAYARVIDRLLQSPRYGERWGRHWLDVARYAETKDLVLLTGPDAIRPYAYTYRDYIIRAFNQDLPFNAMIFDQLAADTSAPRDQPWRLAAMGFLTLGRQFDNNLPDVLDDRIDVVTRGFLGLTVSCARCHDHKYDAITMEDYYSLYGVFASAERPVHLPLTEDPTLTAGSAAFEEKAVPLRKRRQEIGDFQYDYITRLTRFRVDDYLRHVATTKPDPLETAVYFMSFLPGDLRPLIIGAWRRFLREHDEEDPVFGLWHALMRTPESELVSKADAIVRSWLARPRGTRQGHINPYIAAAFRDASIKSRRDVGHVYGELLQWVWRDWQSSSRSRLGEIDPTDSDGYAQLVQIFRGASSPFYFPKRNVELYMNRPETGGYRKAQQAMETLAVTELGAPPRAMVLVDTAELYDPHVFVRGNARQPGKRVPRQFLEVLAGPERRPFAQGSGRVDLARAVSSADNPLTSRVIVNRVWMHHLGEPLVASPSDFGVRSDPPTHPELLDYLAATFLRDGWSLKSLHRRILLSQTYRQASRDRSECRRVDPENRLLWRASRRRLDFESMRDSLLAVSESLDGRMYGRSNDIATDPGDRRRTIYGLVDRQKLPELFRAFDFASADQSVARRSETTVPQQALFGMNSEFVTKQVKSLARAAPVLSQSDLRDRIVAFYRLALGRDPVPDEIEVGLRFVQTAGRDRQEADQLTPWEQYAQVLLLTNEFVYVD